MINYTSAPIPADETERLASLRSLKLLDTAPEERFDRITKLAVYLFHVPIATITLVDSNREWFKSCQGLPNREGKRAISFCGHAMIEEREFIIPDTTKDGRFANNPMVIRKPNIRFYAGIPLRSADGKKIGAFCIKDTNPRKLNDIQLRHLKYLASWAELELNTHELSRALIAREAAELKIINLNKMLMLLSKILRHDMLNDLTVIQLNLQHYLKREKSLNRLGIVTSTVQKSIDLINQVNELETAISTGSPLKSYNVEEVVQNIAGNYHGIKFTISGKVIIKADTAIFSVIENIVKNAKIHGNATKISVNMTQKSDYAEISLADNGIGISDSIKKKIFQEGYAYGKTGNTGLGLYIVKKIVERYGGVIKVKNNIPRGTVFILYLKKS